MCGKNKRAELCIVCVWLGRIRVEYACDGVFFFVVVDNGRLVMVCFVFFLQFRKEKLFLF